LSTPRDGSTSRRGGDRIVGVVVPANEQTFDRLAAELERG
jgi:hypothetical protein